MPSTTQSTQFDTLTPIHLVAGLSVTAAAKDAGLTSTLFDILSDESAPASTRLKAAVAVVKIVEAQRLTTICTALADPKFEKRDTDLRIAAPFGDLIAAPETVPAPNSTPVGRNAPCPCGSPLK